MHPILQMHATETVFFTIPKRQNAQGCGAITIDKVAEL